jgi:hypothetical protein
MNNYKVQSMHPNLPQPLAYVVRRLICPYCKNPADFKHDSRMVYHGKDYGPIYICFPCDAYIGCKKGTYIPLGRLANAELRLWRKKFRTVFDPKWNPPKNSLLDEYGKDFQAKAYTRLARILRIPIQQCHLSNFNAATIKKAVELIEAGVFDDPNRGY